LLLHSSLAARGEFGIGVVRFRGMVSPRILPFHAILSLPPQLPCPVMQEDF
jgi:hypothetical protein